MNIFKLIILFSTMVFAMDFSFEVVSGKYKQSDELNISRANVYGIRNNFHFSPSFAVSIKYDFVDNVTVENTNRFGLGIRFQNTTLDAKFQPFLDLGFGKEIGFSNDRYFQVTLGTKYFLTYQFNFLGEANFIKMKNKSQSYMFALGLGYDFYRKPQVSKYSEKPLDLNLIKNLSKNKSNQNEDIFLVPY